MLSAAEERIQVACGGGNEKEGVMGETDDGRAVLSFVPWQQSQGQRDREPNTEAALYTERTFLLFTCMCAPV